MERMELIKVIKIITYKGNMKNSIMFMYHSTSSIKYLLKVFYMPGTFVGGRDTLANNTDNTPQI